MHWALEHEGSHSTPYVQEHSFVKALDDHKNCAHSHKEVDQAHMDKLPDRHTHPAFEHKKNQAPFGKGHDLDMEEHTLVDLEKHDMEQHNLLPPTQSLDGPPILDGMYLWKGYALGMDVSSHFCRTF